MEELHASLQNIGLTSDEIEVYITLLGMGSVTILQLAQKIDIPRTTIYLLVDSLLKKGLVIETADGKKKLFVAASPKKLLKVAEEKKDQLLQALETLSETIPQLQAVYNVKVDKPKVRSYEGIEGLKHIYEETLNAEEIYVHCMSQNATDAMGDYLTKYFDQLSKKMIYTKEIVSDSKADRDYQENYSTSRNEIITIPAKYISNTDYMIYGDCIAFLTYKGGKQFGVVIEDKELAHFERTRFIMLWNIAKENLLK